MSSLSKGSLTKEELDRIAEQRQRAIDLRQGLKTSDQMKRIAESKLMAKQAGVLHGQDFSPLQKLHSMSCNPSETAKPVSEGYASTVKFAPSLSCPESSIAVRKLSAKNNQSPVGYASMISTTRFKVNIKSNDSIAVFFKGFGDAQYDPETSTWNFSVQLHDHLLDMAQESRDLIDLKGVPEFVLKALRDSKKVSSTNTLQSAIDSTLYKSLRSFQIDAIQLGIMRNGRILLADEIGLGKMIQALGIAHFYKNEWPLLIVTSLVRRRRWQESINKWLPSVPNKDVFMVHSETDSIDLHSNVVIIPHGCFYKRLEGLHGFKVIIMDESQNLNSVDPGLLQSAVPVLQNSNRVILLDDYPAFARPIEMYYQICAINKNLTTKMDFSLRYCRGKKLTVGWDFSGKSNQDELMILLKETIMIRRLKLQVANQLVSEQTVYDHFTC